MRENRSRSLAGVSGSVFAGMGDILLNLPVNKASSQLDQPLKTNNKQHRFKSAEPVTTTQPSSNQHPSSIFIVPQSTIFIDRRINPTPSKVNRNKVQQPLETQLLKLRISELKHMQNQCFADQSMFHDSLKQLTMEEGSEKYLVGNHKQTQYMPYKKRVQNRNLKPILNEIQENQKEGNAKDFFSVQKMVLINTQGKTSKGHLPPKPLKDAEIVNEPKRKKVMSDVQAVRSKFRNGKKSVIIFNRPQEERDQDETLIIRTIEPKTNLQRTQIALKKCSEPISFKQTTKDSLMTIAYQDIQSQKQESSPQQKSPQKRQIRRFNKKFVAPYPTYNYRNLIWKANYSNRMFVEIPVQYEHRLKAYVGKGNNSCMVAGLISRRIWFAFTDKPEQANFVWTQLKQLHFLKKQSAYQGESVEVKGSYLPSSIWSQRDEKAFKTYFGIHISSEQKADERMIPRSKYFKYLKHIKSSEIRQQKLHSHLINNYILGNKKALFQTMSNYYKDHHQDVFSYLPLTFHIKEGLEDQTYFQFLRYFHKRAKNIKLNQQKSIKEYNTWIVKPGENSNRGNGIKMCLNLQEIKAIIKKRQKYLDGTYRTYIVQAYIERPLLYYRRKLDLRHFMMITCINGLIKGYWYREGYVRTTSSEYSMKNNSGSVHLTNDAIQKSLPDYGKYQKGNKISYEELSNYIGKYYKKQGKGFQNHIYPKMKRIATDAIKACSGSIDPSKLTNNFQIFGLDFMIDSSLDVWLIQINTNPCLELSCPLLGTIIPRMVQQALELTMDGMFPPPQRFNPKGVRYSKELDKENKFQLVYDERIEVLYEGGRQVLDSKLLQEQDDTFQDCGEDWQDN